GGRVRRTSFLHVLRVCRPELEALDYRLEMHLHARCCCAPLYAGRDAVEAPHTRKLFYISEFAISFLPIRCLERAQCSVEFPMDASGVFQVHTAQQSFVHNCFHRSHPIYSVSAS